MSAGKHFELIVPNYDQTGSSGSSPLSYFRLGATVDEEDDDETLADKNKRGDDLLDNRESSSPDDPRLRFKDDWRTPTKTDKKYYRDDGTTGSAPGTDHDRLTLTQQLVSRGGWRDHTDGNRISTTRGDCVEVVGGNYKLIVLSRVADEWDPAGLGAAGGSDNVGRTRQEVASGGHYNESTSTPGEVVSITWAAEREDGTWTTVEQTDHGNVKSIYKGYIEDYYFGPSIISKVGESVSAYEIEKDKDTGEGTTAGPHDAELPHITETTYARSIKEQEHYDELIDKTTIKGTGKHEDKLHIGSKAHTKQVYGTITDLKRACFYKESLCATNHNTIVGFESWKNTYTIAGATLDLSFVGFTMTKKAGTAISFSAMATGSLEFAATVSVAIGAFFVDVNTGFSSVTQIGVGAEINVLKLEAKLDHLVSRLFHSDTKALDLKVAGKKNRLFGVKMDG